MRNIFTVLTLLIPCFSIQAQNLDAGEEHALNELGVGNALVYNSGVNYGLHVHLMRGISHRFGVGLGYEAIFAEEVHQTATVFFHFQPMEQLSVKVGPGLTFPTDENNKYEYKGHIEVVRAFDLGKLHLGPMVGLGVGRNESHLSVGLHLGIGF